MSRIVLWQNYFYPVHVSCEVCQSVGAGCSSIVTAVLRKSPIIVTPVPCHGAARSQCYTLHRRHAVTRAALRSPSVHQSAQDHRPVIVSAAVLSAEWFKVIYESRTFYMQESYYCKGSSTEWPHKELGSFFLQIWVIKLNTIHSKLCTSTFAACFNLFSIHIFLFLWQWSDIFCRYLLWVNI